MTDEKVRPDETTYRVGVRCPRDGSERSFALVASQRDLTVEDRSGWSVGPEASGARVVVEEALPDGVRLGIFFMGRHIVLMGLASPPGQTLPAIGIVVESPGEPARFTPGLLRSEVSEDVERLYCRFDDHGLRIGEHEVRFGG